MCDILIVGRGGGSLEDLLPFSDEGVVRAIATSQIPVISAVGHEIDWALSDYAADQRAPTPSAAAELAVPLLSDIEQGIEVSRNEMYESIQGKLEHLRLMLKTFTPESMELQFRHIEQPLSMRFDAARENLALNIQNLLRDKRLFLAQCEQTLNDCNPQTIFDRGYSMVTDEQGKVVRNAASLSPGAKIKIRPASGTISAQVLSLGNS